ncbi:hypothetical protein M472_22135 [Sphingobacterium paucimobilis HER1398]|uniref:Uncharacterized protein n=1 Tax=Sphingobacterium paucimobilis HER1398 TaxID=1346330 RepID=U2I1R7_9SPHI|nr:hypothetical protein M472_22135 [Sphingobacterium paucimobilis HER1398]
MGSLPLKEKIFDEMSRIAKLITKGKNLDIPLWPLKNKLFTDEKLV